MTLNQAITQWVLSKYVLNCSRHWSESCILKLHKLNLIPPKSVQY